MSVDTSLVKKKKFVRRNTILVCYFRSPYYGFSENYGFFRSPYYGIKAIIWGPELSVLRTTEKNSRNIKISCIIEKQRQIIIKNTIHKWNLKFAHFIIIVEETPKPTEVYFHIYILFPPMVAKAIPKRNPANP